MVTYGAANQGHTSLQDCAIVPASRNSCSGQALSVRVGRIRCRICWCGVRLGQRLLFHEAECAKEWTSDQWPTKRERSGG